MKVAQQKICDHRERTGAPASNKYINIYLCVFPRPPYGVRLKEYIFYSPPAVTNINIFWFTAGGAMKRLPLPPPPTRFFYKNKSIISEGETKYIITGCSKQPQRYKTNKYIYIFIKKKEFFVFSY
jgi:hypothetical protein